MTDNSNIPQVLDENHHHLTTAKPIRVTNDDIKVNTIHTCKCGKVFKYRQGLTRHKKQCNIDNNTIDNQEISYVDNNTHNNDITHNPDENQLLQIIRDTFAIYLEKGARSSLKVDFLHKQIKNVLENELRKCDSNYTVKLEQQISSINASGKKKCDIVLYDDNNHPVTVFPVKFIMSNYNQNKNNSWENLTGECCHLKWHDDNIHLKIIPINIIFNTVPYLFAKKKH